MVDHVRERLRGSGLAQGRSASELEWVEGASIRMHSPSASRAAWRPTSGRRSCSASRNGSGRCCSTTTDRSSSSSPARRTRADDHGKELIRQIVSFSHDPDDPRPFHVRRGLRHGARPGPRPGGRRLAEHTRPTDGGVRHERHEGRAQRRLHCSVLDGWWAECFDPATARTDGATSQRVGDLVGRIGDGRGPSDRARGQQPVRTARDPDRAAVPRRIRVDPRRRSGGSRG